MFGKEWKSIAERVEKPKGEPLTFANKFLDQATLGIFPDDLVLVGAPTGSGKTQLCMNIALSNSAMGKKVRLIALEASGNEIHLRAHYAQAAKLYFANEQREKLDRTLSYTNFLYQRLGPNFSNYEEEALEALRVNKDFEVVYGKEEFNVDDLTTYVMEKKDDSDLFIVDHVHYFDWDDNVNENYAIKQIAKTARRLALHIKKPIVLIAHLRKRDRFNKDLCPNLEEFHGSSDLTKIATKVILMSSGGIVEDDKSKVINYVRVAKNRFDSSVTHYVAKVIYDYKLGAFNENYVLGKLVKGNTEFEALGAGSDGISTWYPNNYPDWAKD